MAAKERTGVKKVVRDALKTTRNTSAVKSFARKESIPALTSAKNSRKVKEQELIHAKVEWATVEL